MNKNVDTKELNGQLVKSTPAVWLLVIGMLLTFIAISCNEDEPTIIDPIKPGKRDYVWSIDSVDYQNRPRLMRFESIWGSSPMDIWGVVPDAVDDFDDLWHFDGEKWLRATNIPPLTDATNDIILYATWGTSKNDVWAFGNKNFQNKWGACILHFDGTGWANATPENIVDLKSVLFNVYGKGKNDIWVGGSEYALHYDGNNWVSYFIEDSMVVSSITSSRNNIYLTAYNAYGSNVRKLFRLVDNEFYAVDSTTFTTYKFGSNLWATTSSLKSLANGIISTTIASDGKIDTSRWKRELTTNYFLLQKFIQSPKNIFVVGQGAHVYHYNGSDWKEIFISVPNHVIDPNTSLLGVWTDGSEVFFSDRLNGIVYHGR